METRLILAVPLSNEQAQATKHLMDTPGTCSCGRILKPMDGKFVLGQINSVYSTVADAKNTLVVCIYCEHCFKKINGMFLDLKNSFLKGVQ